MSKLATTNILTLYHLLSGCFAGDYSGNALVDRPDGQSPSRDAEAPVASAPGDAGPGSAPGDAGPDRKLIVVQKWKEDAWSLLTEARVDEVDKNGTHTGTRIPIVEGDTFVVFPFCENEEGGLPAKTTEWLDSRPCVTVVLNPNSAFPENPSGSDEWKDAGVLVRGLVLTEGGDLEVPATLALEDFNVADATQSGYFEQDYDAYTPDDMDIPENLAASLDGIKRILLKSLSPPD